MEGEEGIDFDPTTGEGAADINDLIDDDEFTNLIPRGKETRERWWKRVGRRLGHSSTALRDRMWGDRANLDESRVEYIPLINREIEQEVTNRELGQDTAAEEIRRLYPKAKSSKFLASEDEYGRVTVKLPRANATPYVLQIDGETNPKIPKSLRDLLGPSTSEQAETNDALIARNKEANQHDQTLVDDPQTSEADRTAASDRITEREQENESLEGENEANEESMTLREKVKRIWKKYGPTLTGAVIAAGAVIGAIVAAFTHQLAAVAKGIGNGLKDLGKKLAELLPAAIGAIVSFLFRTAGDAIGWLAKNSWLLIVGVVVYLVERQTGRQKKG